ncbi:MAG: hypothetical protein DCC59_09445 [Chloroflexi bacterium]|nr:hypothetical protein [Chloroflexi bacterium CFX1]MCK6568696.1 hypothetical protein [Anaerolineales bacterium]MCQ3953540.1 hypothetical protein [Chloroflexota bacterium]MDL1918662.1 hypothetical protein [Chloroflexi bacterium CFX5]NUQ58845.1 hypothetical protein [Anaerolineales bacterium]
MNRFSSIALAILFLLAACSGAPAADQPQSPAPTQSAGSVLFQDDFAQPITGWDRLLVTEGVMDYYSGGYRILVNSLQTNFWATPRRNFTDVRVEVDTGKLAGPDENRIGVLCRYSDGDYYFFIVTSDGYYGMGLFKDGQAALLGQSEMLPSASINKGLAINHLRADCAGDTLTFFVNGSQIAQVQDAALTSGDVGIIAGSFGAPGVDVIFDNFVVLQP